MSETLQAALAEIINQLASFFGTTTDAILTKLPEFLTRYAWYHTLTWMPGTIFAGLGAGLFLAFIVAAINNFNLKHPGILTAICCTLGVIIAIIIAIIPCFICPEIVGGHAIIELIKGAK